MPIVLAHNLDDCVEQYVINTVVRPSKTVTIRYNGPSNTIRPFRTWKKSDIIDYAKRNNLTYIEDPSNSDDSLTRNYVRHQIIPLILNVNPGLYTQVKEKVLLDKAETTVYL